MNGTKGPLSRLTSEQNLYYFADEHKNPKAKVKVQVQLLMEIIFLEAAPKKGGFFYLLTKKLQTSPSAII